MALVPILVTTCCALTAALSPAAAKLSQKSPCFSARAGSPKLSQNSAFSGAGPLVADDEVADVVAPSPSTKRLKFSAAALVLDCRPWPSEAAVRRAWVAKSASASLLVWRQHFSDVVVGYGSCYLLHVRLYPAVVARLRLLAHGAAQPAEALCQRCHRILLEVVHAGDGTAAAAASHRS